VHLTDTAFGDPGGLSGEGDGDVGFDHTGQVDSVEIHMRNVAQEDVPLQILDHHGPGFLIAVGERQIDEDVHAGRCVQSGAQRLALHGDRHRIPPPPVDDSRDQPIAPEPADVVLSQAVPPFRFQGDALHGMPPNEKAGNSPAESRKRL